MPWIIFAILSIIGTALSHIVRKKIMKDKTAKAIPVTILYQFLSTIIIAIAAFINGFTMPDIAKYPLNFLLDAVLWGFAMLFLFKAYEYIEASEATIITTLQSVFAIISALLFLGETFTLPRIIGTVLIIFGVIYVSLSSKKLVFNKGVLFAFGFSLFGGLALTNDTYVVSQGADPLSYLIFVYGLPFLFMILVQPHTLKYIKRLLKPKLFSQIFLLAFLYGGAAIAFFLALGAGAQISQLAPINQASVIVTLLLAAVFLKETDHMVKKLFCGVLVFVGVFLLT